MDISDFFIHDTSDSALGPDYSIKCKQVDGFRWVELVLFSLDQIEYVIPEENKATVSGKESCILQEYCIILTSQLYVNHLSMILVCCISHGQTENIYRKRCEKIHA